MVTSVDPSQKDTLSTWRRTTHTSRLR